MYLKSELCFQAAIMYITLKKQIPRPGKPVSKTFPGLTSPSPIFITLFLKKMHIFETTAYNLILYLFMLNFMEIGMLINYINLSFRGTQIYKLNCLECVPFGLPGLHRALT